MAEFLRPDADVTDGGWTNEAGGTSLFASVNEAAFDDANYIQSSPDPVNDLNRLRLPAPSGSIIEPVTVRYRFHKVGSGSVNQTVRLVQGASTTIAEWIHTDISASFVTAEQTLTPPQFELITDSSDLFVEMVAGSGAVVGTAPIVDVPSIEVGVSFGGTTVISAGLTTSNANEIVVVCVCAVRTNAQGSATTVTGVTDNSAGLTYAKAPGAGFSFQSGAPGTPFIDVEIWWALAASAGAVGAITATFAATIDDASIVAFGVSGCGNTSAPWDASGAFSANSGSSSAPSVTGVSTTSPGTLLIMMAGAANTSAGYTDQTAGTGFTLTADQNSDGGTNFSEIAVQTKGNTTAQSGITTSFPVSWNGWIALTHALVGT